MSSEISTNLIIPEPAEELIASEPWSMETYADGLIDDLFAEIDTILDGSKKLPLQKGNPSKKLPPYTHAQTVSMPQIALPESSTQTAQTAPQSQNNQLSTFVVNTSRAGKLVRQQPQQSHYRSRLLQLLATFGLAIAGIVWISNSNLLSRLESKSFRQALEISQPPLQPPIYTKEDVAADFANYILEALAAIDRQDGSNYLSSANTLISRMTSNRTTLPYVKPTDNLPPVLTGNNTSPIPNRSTSVVERIYIPVYQAPLPMRYVPSATSGIANTLPQLPSTASTAESAKSSSENTGHKPVKPADLLAGIQSKLKPVDVNPAAIPVQQASQPAIPSLPKLAPPKLPTATAPEAASVISSPAGSSHTLEGLLELGNKSAALFKVSGITRRVEIGESIGSSGWTLVDVANGEAIIRRNGEVRSIFAGQSF
ncbi:hypothetical protein QUB80_13145 [Chlorogloeopsis sp. ULAP01]|uniref:hypothetical protein n=1 Tax=Chlorogloeopsis sp. ULAP01 TaxID=3056483 RepID=UPI0025AA5787|nr:hypothetical protein [Chlorogloeopsis sp. ULAP01]MDM9381648.1 hypothetical protein [Chlorogloeopsis sp. ULAP01]